jgi:hypothetical protein
MTEGELPEYAATHRCVVCGALWRFNPAYIAPHGTSFEASWSVRSAHFGQCCDRGYMDLIMIPLDADPL